MKVEKKFLLDMLQENNVTFFIPPYQRNYEWEEEQCKVFFNDIVATYKLRSQNVNAKHFVGSITYFETKSRNTTFDRRKELVLIDGQQRITTTMIFLSALRDSIEDEETKNNINHFFLLNNQYNDDNKKNKIKLKQVETDFEAYKKIIFNEEFSQNEKESAVFINYRFFLNEIKDFKKNNSTCADDLSCQLCFHISSI